MGTNKRYAESINRDISKRIEQVADKVDKPQAITLTPLELDVENHPVKQAKSVVPVRAWVRFPETAVQTEAEAFEWTDKAVHISWKTSDGSRRQAWVWASSVERI